VLVSPVLAGLAVGIGVPILLFYVYGVVPVSLCRSGGCGVSTSDAVSMDAVSHRGGNPSIGEVSLSLGSGSQLERLGRENDRESASNVALAGASIAGSIASSLLPGGQRLASEELALMLAHLWKSTLILQASAGSESSSWTAGGEDGGSERVRFDDHVSFIAPHSYETSHNSQCDKECSGSGRGRWWSTESRCRRELSCEDHTGDSETKKIPSIRQELAHKAVDECVTLDGDEDDDEGDDNDAVVTAPIPCVNVTSAVTTATIPAITTSSAPATACYHGMSKSDMSADKLHGVSSINGCNKAAPSVGLRNVFFHAPAAETKRLPKLRKPQESVGPVVDGEQQSSARQTPTLPVIPEPSTDQSHASPPGDEHVKIEIPIETD
ncbi:hypothetical protein C0J52_01712, partial [Blattella germanica]